MGFQVTKDGTITYREWAPGAHSASLIGEFSACFLLLDGIVDAPDVTTPHRQLES